MPRLKWSVVLVLFLIAAQPGFADDRTKILGTCVKHADKGMVRGILAWERGK